MSDEPAGRRELTPEEELLRAYLLRASPFDIEMLRESRGGPYPDAEIDEYTNFVSKIWAQYLHNEIGDAP